MFETLIGLFIATVSPTLPISPQATIEPSPTPIVKKQTATNQDRVISLVNSERKKNNLNPLTKNIKLYNAAQSYAQNMATANFFSHTGIDGSSFSTRIKNAKYGSYSWIAENIAAGQSTPEAVVKTWMKSPGHRDNILNSKAQEIGVGFYYSKTSKYKYYWVQEFGSK